MFVKRYLAMLKNVGYVKKLGYVKKCWWLKMLVNKSLALLKMFGTFFDRPMGQHAPMWFQMGPCEPICAQWSPYGIIWADVGSYSFHVGPGGTYAAIWAHMGSKKPCGRTCSKPRLSQVPGPRYPYIHIDKHHTRNKHIFHTAIHKNVSSLGYDPFAGPALELQRGRIKHPSVHLEVQPC